MQPRAILILEDKEDRVRGFQSAIASMGREFAVRIWHHAPAMIADSPAYFAETCLMSLDHDLQAMDGEADPGTGQDVARFFSLHSPLCPVILHTSNFDGRLVMHNRLRAGGWTVATVPPRESDWM